MPATAAAAVVGDTTTCRVARAGPSGGACHTASATTATAMSCVAQAKENEAEQEVTVKFEDLPQVVQTTFKEESRGATITTVEKEIEKGETVYEAEGVEIKGRKYDIEVSEDGTLIEKSLAEADDDDEEDDD